MNLLANIHKQYRERVKAIKEYIVQKMDIVDLFYFFQFHSVGTVEISRDRQVEEHAKEFAQFAMSLSNDPQFREKLLESYSNSFVKNPIDEINTILKRYNFYYTIKGIPDSHEWKLVFQRDAVDNHVGYDKLSSGERMLVCMLTWMYRVHGLTLDRTDLLTKIDNKVKIILLDEPDKHLDPKLCKLLYKVIHEEFVLQQGIQVIMTTHRIDTVALAPTGSIFIIENNDDYPGIIECHKLQAMFRMTSNLRELIGYHHRVYTESLDDMLFYEGVYGSLRGYCAEIREHQTINSDYYWYLDTAIIRRLLSERYQLSFYTFSTKKGDEGGCAIVVQTVQRDLNTHTNSKQKHMFKEPELHRSFGILDRDYGKDYQLSSKGIVNYATILKRHSLENFIFDPFIFCATLTTEEIKKFVMLSNIINHKLKNTETQVSTSSTTFRKDEEEGDVFIATCLEIKQSLSTSSFFSIQTPINTYFSIILKIMDHYHQFTKKQKPEEIPVYKAIEDKVQNGNICDTAVQIIVRDDLNQVSPTMITVQYPREYLEVRGHDIAEFFMGKKNQWVVTETIASRVQQDGLQYIPLDLADTFFTLNQQVRENVRKIIKPGKVDSGPMLDREHPHHQKVIANVQTIEHKQEESTFQTEDSSQNTMVYFTNNHADSDMQGSGNAIVSGTGATVMKAIEIKESITYIFTEIIPIFNKSQSREHASFLAKEGLWVVAHLAGGLIFAYNLPGGEIISAASKFMGPLTASASYALRHYYHIEFKYNILGSEIANNCLYNVVLDAVFGVLTILPVAFMTSNPLLLAYGAGQGAMMSAVSCFGNDDTSSVGYMAGNTVAAAVLYSGISLAVPPPHDFGGTMLAINKIASVLTGVALIHKMVSKLTDQVIEQFNYWTYENTTDNSMSSSETAGESSSWW